VTVASTYDPRDLLSSRTWSGGGIDAAGFSQLFNAAWERTELDRFAGTQLVAKSLYTYDRAGREKTITHQDALANVLADYQYNYDLAGQLLNESHHGITFGYGYDPNGELTSETRSDQPPTSERSWMRGQRAGCPAVLQASRLASASKDCWATACQAAANAANAIAGPLSSGVLTPPHFLMPQRAGVTEESQHGKADVFR
jgi:YD repeat-containing protein